jgi:hypothetical protein
LFEEKGNSASLLLADSDQASACDLNFEHAPRREKRMRLRKFGKDEFKAAVHCLDTDLIKLI